MPAAVADAEKSPAEQSTEDDVGNKHVLRQAQLSRELQELNEMLADKQQLAGQMMRSDEHLASVRLQYEVRRDCILCVCIVFIHVTFVPCRRISPSSGVKARQRLCSALF